MSWLISKALMNSLSLPERVEEYLGDIYSGLEQSVLLNGMRIPQAYCAFDKMTDYSRLSRSGMMCKPLMDILGEELLMWFREDFPAKTSVLQEKEQDLTENDQDFGEKCFASFARWDQDSYLWKTPQTSLLGDLEPFSETWPRWGLMQDGECSELVTLAQNTRGTESGLWPTPTTPTGGGNVGGSGAYRNAILRGTHIPRSINPNLYEWLMGWPQGWTALEPLVMDKSQFVQQLRGES